MTLDIAESDSPAKAIPGLVATSPTGLAVHAQTVRLGSDVYELPEVAVPLAYPGEPTEYRVVLAQQDAGATLVLDARAIGESQGPVPGEVVCLARLTLRAPEDTPESVDVWVPRRTCTTETPEDAVVHVVAPDVVPPVETPERARARAQRARERALSARVRAGTPGQWTMAERDALLELVALRLGIEVGR